MTTRERLERRMERREEWAAKRQEKARAAFAGAREAMAGIEPGQPILVGHHSERRHRAALARHDARMSAAVESSAMAEHHASKAEGLSRQLDRSIFRDDDNAVDALQARIDDLESKRARIVAYNKSARKAAKEGRETGDLSLLSEDQKGDLLNALRACPYHIKPGAPMPSYVLSNLSGNIKRNKDRLAQIERDNAQMEAAQASETGVTITGGDYVTVTFAEKPDRATLDALRAAGFHWRRPSWHGRRESLPECVTGEVGQ